MQLSLSKHWLVRPQVPPEQREVLRDYPPFLQQILYNRGIVDRATAESFLSGRCPEGCDPYALTGIHAAVARLKQAIQAGEPIAIYGDYDVDGVTSTVLLVQVLHSLGAVVSEYIPDRLEEGYGLNREALDALLGRGFKVVVTVDNGIRSLDEAAYAHQIGLDMIITDHHHPQEILPEAVAVIDPKQAGDSYPDKNLSGVGVAFKLAQALVQSFPGNGVYVEDWLDLVALGTVADLVPLVGENRYFVREGLKRIRAARRQGLYSLAEVSRLDIEKTNTGDIGFILGPRLNAAGRVESALKAFQLLNSNDILETGRLAQELDDQNQKRKLQTQAIEAQVEAMLAEKGAVSFLIFAYDESFSAGVVGLAASHLAEAYHRPAIVANRNEKFTRGSARSIPGFHITNALDECQELMEHHGGHEQAAGFTVKNENLDVLIARLMQIAERDLRQLDLRPQLVADIELPLNQVVPSLMNHLDLLQPLGEGNPEPVIVSRNLRVMYPKVVGKEGKHLKFKVTDGWATFDAIAFRQGHRLPEMSGMVDVAYTFERNDFNGWAGFQFNVKDIKRSGTPD